MEPLIITNEDGSLRPAQALLPERIEYQRLYLKHRIEKAIRKGQESVIINRDKVDFDVYPENKEWLIAGNYVIAQDDRAYLVIKLTPINHIKKKKEQ